MKLAAEDLNERGPDNGGPPALTPPITAISLMTPQRSCLEEPPPDFHPTAYKNLDACFGEAIQVLHDDQIMDPILEGLEKLD
jgi:hypothetical protein